MFSKLGEDESWVWGSVKCIHSRHALHLLYIVGKVDCMFVAGAVWGLELIGGSNILYFCF